MKLASTASHSHHMVSSAGLITDHLNTDDLSLWVTVTLFVVSLVIGIFSFVVGSDCTLQKDAGNHENKRDDRGYDEEGPTPMGYSL